MFWCVLESLDTKWIARTYVMRERHHSDPQEGCVTF